IKKLVLLKELQPKMGRSMPTVFHWAETKGFPNPKFVIGKTRLYDRDEIQAWLADWKANHRLQSFRRRCGRRRGQVVT
ncbi:MAG TPA: hypothetical protein VF852_12350, partial [Pseudolabrys sp.]